MLPKPKALQLILVGIWKRLTFAAISLGLLWLGFFWATLPLGY